jgi:hypothetical protein
VATIILGSAITPGLARIRCFVFVIVIVLVLVIEITDSGPSQRTNAARRARNRPPVHDQSRRDQPAQARNSRPPPEATECKLKQARVNQRKSNSAGARSSLSQLRCGAQYRVDEGAVGQGLVHNERPAPRFETKCRGCQRTGQILSDAAPDYGRNCAVKRGFMRGIRN